MSEKAKAKADKHRRIDAANELLMVIATHGGRFFNYAGETWKGRKGETHRGHISHFHADERGRVYLESGYTGKPCYRRPSFTTVQFSGNSFGGFGQKFTEGGNLNQLCQDIHDFITTGCPQPLNIGPWYCDGDLWGYGDDMAIIRDAAKRLGIWDAS